MLHPGLLGAPPFKVLRELRPVSWHKAGLISAADADALGTWSDLSQNGNDFSQATAAKKPLFKVNIINGKSVVRFDGVNDLMTNAGLATYFNGTAPTVTVICVARPVALSTNARVWQADKSTDAAPFHTLAQDVLPAWATARRNDANTYKEVLTGTPVAGTAQIISYLFDGTTGFPFVNNVAGVATNLAGTCTGMDQFNLGATRNGGAEAAFYNVDIAELIVCNYLISDSQRRRAERYLGKEYGILV